MTVEHTTINGLLAVSWDTHGDERGFFRQTYQLDELTDALGRTPDFCQGNHSRSRPGVLRGFHAEPWDKLVYVVRGTALAVVADVRPDSPTFGEIVTYHLGDAPGQRMRLFIADGLANAFCAFGDGPVDYLYEVSRRWQPDVDKRGIAWDDPDLDVPWPVEDPILSDADLAHPTLRERFPTHTRFAS